MSHAAQQVSLKRQGGVLTQSCLSLSNYLKVQSQESLKHIERFVLLFIKLILKKKEEKKAVSALLWRIDLIIMLCCCTFKSNCLRNSAVR